MFIDFREIRERKRNINVRNINRLPPILALTGDQTHKVGVCPDQELDLQPFGVQADTPTN